MGVTVNIGGGVNITAYRDNYQVYYSEGSVTNNKFMSNGPDGNTLYLSPFYAVNNILPIFY